MFRMLVLLEVTQIRQKRIREIQIEQDCTLEQTKKTVSFYFIFVQKMIHRFLTLIEFDGIFNLFD